MAWWLKCIFDGLKYDGLIKNFAVQKDIICAFHFVLNRHKIRRMALRQTIRWSDEPRNPFCNSRFYSKTFINICMSRCVWIKIKNVGCALILACGARETRGIWPRAILNYWTPFQIESLTHPQHLRQATIDFSCEMKNRDKDPQKLRL